MLAQIVAEVVIEHMVAFMAGLYAATSPCLFPLLPLFLIRSLQSEDSRKKSVVVTGALISGILASLGLFALISYVISTYFLLQYYTQIQAALGAIIVFVGILTLSQKLREKIGLTRLSMKNPDTPKGLVGVFVVGFSYALIAAPCTAPVVILGLPLVFGVSALANPLLAVSLFIWLSIGVAIPYLAIALVTGEARNRMATRIANAAHVIEIAVGLLLIVLGLWLMSPWILSMILV